MADWRSELRSRLIGLKIRPEREADIIDELAQHLDDQVRESIADGVSPVAARAAALAELDAPGELARRLAQIEARPPLELPIAGPPSRWRWLTARWQDVHYSIRALRRSPVFALTVIATFALTIGPTSAILSLGNWLLWRPTPGVSEPQRLAVIWVGEWSDNGHSVAVANMSYLNLQDLQRASRTLTAIAGLQESSASISGESLPAAYGSASYITANALDVLGVPVMAGRPFRAEDDAEPNGERVVMVSESLARRGFGDAARAVNQQIKLNGRPMTIVGVLPERFTGITPMSRVSVWYPGTTYPYVNHFVDKPRPVTREGGLFHSFVARLAPEATFEQAQSELNVLVPALAESHPDVNKKFQKVRARLFPGLGPRELQRETYARKVRVLLAIGGALLLLGCANVTNILMVRGVRTARDRAIRLALGASRARLAMILLTESGLLAVTGASLGLLLAVWLKQLIVSLLFPGVPPALMYQVPLDGRVLSLTLGVSVTCGLLAGLVPAFIRRGASVTAAGGRSVTGSQWLRSGFAGLQFALSLALVVGSMLLAATLRNLHSVDLGFDPSGVTRHSVDPQRHGYTGARALTYYQDLVTRLNTRPGIDAASVAGRLPFGSSWRVRVHDPAGVDRPQIQVLSNNVDASYFDVLDMPIVRGRAFAALEGMTPLGTTSMPVIVSESLARRIFGTEDAVGKSFLMPAGGNAPKRDVNVIGVVRDVYWTDLTAEKPMLLYQPYPQFPFGGTLLVRSQLPSAEVARIVDDVAREIDASLPVSATVTLTSLIESETAEQRTFAWVLSLVGWIAFLLAAVGLYGLLAQSVVERTREFGIRLAIGSGRPHVFGLVLKQAGWIAFGGTVAGLVLAYFGTRMIETQLHGVARLDVPSYAIATIALVVVVCAAGLWPATLATRIQPVEALRAE